MTANILHLTGAEAYDLIFPEHLAMMSKVDQEIMKRTMDNSPRVWLGSDGPRVLALWGLIPPTLLSDRAYLWLFTTPALAGHEFIFIRHSQRAVQDMLQQFDLIVGNTLSDNARAIRWLRWLGAEFQETPMDGVLHFEIRAAA